MVLLVYEIIVTGYSSLVYRWLFNNCLDTFNSTALLNLPTIFLSFLTRCARSNERLSLHLSNIRTFFW